MLTQKSASKQLSQKHENERSSVPNQFRFIGQQQWFHPMENQGEENDDYLLFFTQENLGSLGNYSVIVGHGSLKYLTVTLHIIQFHNFLRSIGRSDVRWDMDSCEGFKI